MDSINLNYNKTSQQITYAYPQQELNEIFQLEQQKAKQSEEYNKRAPIPCPVMDRAVLLLSFQMELMQKKETMQRVQRQQAALMKKTWITGKLHCCTKPLAELKPLNLAQMKVPFVHEGHFLVCRVLTEAMVTVATQTVVEDMEGHVQVVSFYNFNADLNNSSWLKPGTIALIKEPHMKYSSNSNTLTPFIRVDSPSDVIFVHKSNRDMLKLAGALCWYEPETMSSEELKKCGNAEFTKGQELKKEGNVDFSDRNFEDALGYYQRALALIANKENGDLAPVLHLNMAAALLELKRYSETIEEAKKALEGGANKEKAFYRLGCAAYGMRHWSEAIDHFESALKENPALSLTAQKLGKAKARLAESLTGIYNLKKLLDEEEKGQRLMDVANYIGPVKIAEIPGKGKGLILTEDVPKGTLLLAEKAYAFVLEEGNATASLSYSLNLVTNELNTCKQLMCIIETIQRLKREPQKAKELYGLYAGDETWSMPTMDGVIDTGRIERICSLNWFNPHDDRKTSVPNACQSEEEVNSEIGLWIMPSFANHSCLSNIQMAFYGDLMMVRAICDLKKGDEVTVHYQPPLNTYEQRRGVLALKWGFQCDCRLCELDSQECPKVAKERNQLVKTCTEELKKQQQLQWPQPCASLAKLLPLVNGIRHNYGDRNELRTQLFEPLTGLAYVYQLLNDSEKTLEVCNEIFDALGPLLIYNYVPVVFFRMIQTYARGMDNREMAKNTIERAFQMVQHKYGPMDKKLFFRMFPVFESYK